MHCLRKSVWLASAAAALPLVALGSSHREAPFITEHPKVDGTDFYMFRSYESGRDGYVTLIANYLPLQDAYGGPNYFTLDPNAVYDIHIDNDGDAKEDVTFRFPLPRIRSRTSRSTSAAPATCGRFRCPLITTAPGAIGPGALDRGGLNVFETYTVELIRGGQPQFRPRVDERRRRRRLRRCSQSPSTTWATSRFLTMPPTPQATFTT